MAQEHSGSSVLSDLLGQLAGTNTVAKPADVLNQAILQAKSPELVVLFAGPEVLQATDKINDTQLLARTSAIFIAGSHEGAL